MAVRRHRDIASAEQKLRQSEERFRTIYEHAPVMIDAFDEHGRCLLWNRECVRNLGWTARDVRRARDPLALPYPDPAKRNEVLQTIKSADGKFREYDVLTKDGGTRTQLWANFRLPDGTIISIGHDITERKKRDLALMESEAKYRAIFAEARDGIVLLDDRGCIVDCNPEFEHQTGYKLSELKRIQAWELRPPEERENAKSLFDALSKRGAVGTTEQVFERPSGERVLVELRGRKVILSDVCYYEGTTRDITARRKAEESIRERDARIHLVMEQAPAVLWTTDETLRISSCTGSGLKKLRLRVEDLVGKTLQEYFQTDDPTFEAIDAHRRALGGEPRTYDLRIADRILVCHVEAMRDGSNNVIGVSGIALDVTPQRTAEEAVKESEARLRQIIDLVPHMIFAKDRDGRFLLANYAVAQAYGTTVDHLMNARHADVHESKAELEKFLRDDRTVIDTGEPKFIPEESFVDVHGDERVLQTTKIPIQLPNMEDRAVLGVAVDITERKHAEERLKSSESQLRALASRVQAAREEESAGIAREIHDELGQALTGLKLDISWVQRRIAELDGVGHCDQISELLGSMSNEIDRTIQTVRRISTQLRPVILDDMGLLKALEWQAQEFERRTSINCEFDVRNEDCELEPNRSTAVFRIFQEILTNVARHARATRVRVEISKKDGQLMVDVVDNGRGISDEEARSPHALGILGMRERAQVCRGNVGIGRVRGGGTRVTVVIPLEEEPGAGTAESGGRNANPSR